MLPATLRCRHADKALCDRHPDEHLCELRPCAMYCLCEPLAAGRVAELFVDDEGQLIWVGLARDGSAAAYHTLVALKADGHPIQLKPRRPLPPIENSVPVWEANDVDGRRWYARGMDLLLAGQRGEEFVIVFPPDQT